MPHDGPRMDKDDIPGQAWNSLKSAWTGYKTAIANNNEPTAKEFASVINGIRAAFGEAPLQFTELDGYTGVSLSQSDGGLGEYIGVVQTGPMNLEIVSLGPPDPDELAANLRSIHSGKGDFGYVYRLDAGVDLSSLNQSPKKVETEGEFIHVRFRDPDKFAEIRTPDWAERVSTSVSEGSKVRMGRLEGTLDWQVQSVLIRKNVGESKAEDQAVKIVDKIENEPTHERRTMRQSPDWDSIDPRFAHQ